MHLSSDPSFNYFAYGSCMCPVDLERTLGERAHPYVLGIGQLEGYRLGFNLRSRRRNCGVLDIKPDSTAKVMGVLYRLPWRFSDRLDEREDVARGSYRRETVDVVAGDRCFRQVRTYVAVNKLAEEQAPNDWYFNVVLRGAAVCGLPEEYCWQLFHHMRGLQERQRSQASLRCSQEKPLPRSA